jgi:hypothetical protein
MAKPSERDDVLAAVEIAERIGYQHLICHLKAAFVVKLMDEQQRPEKSAVDYVNKCCQAYPQEMHRDLVKSEWWGRIWNWLWY